jgi:hypothetical protein
MLKITACWDVMTCSLVINNVSEEHAASIFRVEWYDIQGRNGTEK